MAARFLLGPAGSGKTHLCFQALREHERKGEPAIYLVPEQFTYSADRELLESGDLPGLRHVRVFSFSRLAWWIRERSGAAPLPAIDEAARTMLLRALLDAAEPASLGPLAAVRHRTGVLQQLSRFIGEVRNHGPQSFLHGIVIARDTARGRATPAGILTKLETLARVYELYAQRLESLGKSDPEERLRNLEPLIAGDAGFFATVHVYVDGFLSWTRRESEILVSLAAAGADLSIALCCDPAEQSDPRIPFHPVFRSLRRLEERLARASVRIEPPVTFGPGPRFHNPLLGRIERIVFSNDPPDMDPTGSVEDARGVELLEAPDRRLEVTAWARRIDRWLRLDRESGLDKGESPFARPGEIAVLLRDVEPYRDLVREIFPLYDIPFFLDERRSILAHPEVRLLLGALEIALSGWRRDAVIAFLRNPLLGVPLPLVDLLENRSREFGRDFEHWYSDQWEDYSHPGRASFHDPSKDPLPEPLPEEAAGSDAAEESETEPGDARVASTPQEGAVVSPEIVRTEAIRLAVLRPLQEFFDRWRQETWTGARASTEIASLLESMRGDAGAMSPFDEHDEQIGVALRKLLDDAGSMWTEVTISVEEFARSIREGLLTLRLGVTPMRMDQVLVGDVQRSRVLGIRHAVIGGVNEGTFPRSVSDDPILNERDRAALFDLGVPLGPTALERQEEEAYLFYIALTRASESMLLSWSATDAMGKEMPASLALRDLQAMLGLTSERVRSTTDDLALVQAPRELGRHLLAKLSSWMEDPARELRVIGSSNAPVVGGSIVDGKEGRVASDGSASGQQKCQTDQSGDLPPGNVPLTLPWVVEALSGRPIESAVLHATEGDANRFRAIRSVEAEIENGRGVLHRPQIWLPPDLLPLVFEGAVFESSVSRLQEFAGCPFQSFARSLLRLVPRPRAKVSPLETGTLAHSALENIFVDTPHGAEDLNRRLLAVFAALEGSPDFHGFRVDEASRYRWGSTRRALLRYLMLESERLRVSPYRILARELRFGMGDAGLEIPLPEGKVLRIRGQIDRVDVHRDDEGAARPRALVIDYKRSARTGLPRGIEDGADLQLAAYMLYLRNVRGLDPVAGLYVPVVPSPRRAEDTGRNVHNRLELHAHGVFLKEEATAIDGGVELLVSRGPQHLADRAVRDALLDRASNYLASYATTQRRGWIEPRPLLRESRRPCERCDYPGVCRFRREIDPDRRTAIEGMVAVPRESSSASESAVSSRPSGDAANA